MHRTLVTTKHHLFLFLVILHIGPEGGEGVWLGVYAGCWVLFAWQDIVRQHLFESLLEEKLRWKESQPLLLFSVLSGPFLGVLSLPICLVFVKGVVGRHKSTRTFIFGLHTHNALITFFTLRSLSTLLCDGLCRRLRRSRGAVHLSDGADIPEWL